jgi:hypothetical protein
MTAETSLRRRALLALGAATSMPAALRLALAQSAAAQGMRNTRGEVRVNGNPAVEGSPVLPGDTIETGRRGYATFVVGGDAFLVRANSRAELIGSGGLLDAMRLVAGGLLSVFGSGRTRRLVTATASIGIRGTGAYLEAEPGRTYFCLCYGTADVAAAAGGAQETVTTTHHESPRYIYGDGRSRAITPAYMSNHADSELMLLESLVGRSPPTEFMMGGGRY